MEDLPKWLQYAILLFGSTGIVWTVWTKFGDAIKKTLSIRNDIKSGSLENESQEIDVMAKYKAFLNSEMDDLMAKYTKLKIKVEADHKLLTDQLRENSRIMARQKKYIQYTVEKLVQNKIEHKPYTDE